MGKDPYGGGNKHHRHRRDQEIRRLLHLGQAEDTRHKSQEEENQSVDPRGNGKRYYSVQDLPHERNQQDPKKLRKVFHTEELLRDAVIVFITAPYSS